jgi:hypothetical protein
MQSYVKMTVLVDKRHKPISLSSARKALGIRSFMV